MEYRIVSNRELSDTELSKISGIMAESECPNESLRNTFQDYIGTDRDVIVIGSSGGGYSYSFAV